MVTLFTQRLTRRGYKLEDIQKYTSAIRHSVRDLPFKQKNTLSLVRPIMKCLSVPNLDQLKQIILNNLPNRSPKPLMCFLKHRKISASLVSSKTGDCTPEQEQDINSKLIPLESTSPQAVPLPKPVPHSKSLGFTPCRKHSCRLCPNTYKCTYFKSWSTKKAYHLRSKLSCSSKFVVYLITCKACSHQYVGSTIRPLRHRFYQHTWAIRNGSKLYLHLHFQRTHTINDINIMAIDQAFTESSLRQLEQFWIQELGTRKPRGLNIY